MTSTDDIDVVAESVAAYSDHVAAYATYNADKVADELDWFTWKLPAGASVLDAGCGPGRDLARLTTQGFDAIGVDLNPDFVAAASAHGTAVLGDLRDLPFNDESFDAVWACASLVHLPTDDAARALVDLARVARPGARLWVSVKHAGETGWAQTVHGRRWFQIWDRDEFADAVHAAGWNVHDVEFDDLFLNVCATRA